MIRLVRPPAPAELTTSKAADLTAQFSADPAARVWNKSYIKKALLEMSKDKCAYCETKVTNQSKYMEVEHFYCKHTYRNLVVAWTNLLPSCKKCNVKKGKWDVINSGMLVDPTNADPKDHFYIKNYRYNHKTKNGYWTIFVLNLNDQKRLAYPRFLLGHEVQDKLAKARVSLDNFISNTSNNHDLKIAVNTIEGILSQTETNEEYSATISTIVIQDHNYQSIKKDLEIWQEWNKDMQKLHLMAENNALVEF